MVFYLFGHFFAYRSNPGEADCFQRGGQGSPGLLGRLQEIVNYIDILSQRCAISCRVARLAGFGYKRGQRLPGVL